MGRRKEWGLVQMSSSFMLSVDEILNLMALMGTGVVGSLSSVLISRELCTVERFAHPLRRSGEDECKLLPDRPNGAGKAIDDAVWDRLSEGTVFLGGLVPPLGGAEVGLADFLKSKCCIADCRDVFLLCLVPVLLYSTN